MDEEIALELQATGIGLSIADQCRLLKINRASYYRWKAHQEQSVREERQRQLDAKKDSEISFATAVLDAWQAHPTYGYRKLSHYMLRSGHLEATEKRVRLMYQRLGLKGLRPKLKNHETTQEEIQEVPVSAQRKDHCICQPGLGNGYHLHQA